MEKIMNQAREIDAINVCFASRGSPVRLGSAPPTINSCFPAHFQQKQSKRTGETISLVLTRLAAFSRVHLWVIRGIEKPLDQPTASVDYPIGRLGALSTSLNYPSNLDFGQISLPSRAFAQVGAA